MEQNGHFPDPGISPKKMSIKAVFSGSNHPCGKKAFDNYGALQVMQYKLEIMFKMV